MTKEVIKALASVLRKVETSRRRLDREVKRLRSTPHPLHEMAQVDWTVERLIGDSRGMRRTEEILKRRIEKTKAR